MFFASRRPLRRSALFCAAVLALCAALALLAPPGALCLSCRSADAGSPRLILRQGLVWRAADPLFGGLSGLAMTGDGTRLVALGDQGTLFETDVIREPAHGTITGFGTVDSVILRGNSGRPLTPFGRDSEDLAQTGTGDLFIAFEGYARVVRYPADAAGRVSGEAGTRQHSWDLFEERFGNTGFEALLHLPGGGLLAIAESPLPGLDLGPGAPAYAWLDGRWRHVFDLPAPGGFTVSGADLGPDGRLWLLERRLDPAGFVTRIRRFALDLRDGTVALGPADTLLWARLGPRDNYEGISLWQDGAGRTIATLVSDDGFSLWQRTVLSEFVLADPNAPLPPDSALKSDR